MLELRDDAAVASHGVRDDVDGRRRSRGVACGLQFRFGALQARRDCGGESNPSERIGQPLDLALELGDRVAAPTVVGAGSAAQLGQVIAHAMLERGDGCRREQLGAHEADDCRLGGSALDAHAATHDGAAILACRAAVFGTADGDHGASAASALEQAAQEHPGLRSLPRATAQRPPSVQALLRDVPERSVEDAQLGLLFDDPLGLRPRDALATTGLGILDELAAIPHVATDVKLVAEHP